MPKDEQNVNALIENYKGELKHLVSQLRELIKNDFKLGQLLFENRSYYDVNQLGSVLGNKGSKEILQGYLSQFNFKDTELGPSLKVFLEQGGFNLPQERDMIDNILDAFAQEFIETNPDNKISSNPQDISAVVLSTLLLNTDLTSSMIKQKMTEKEFINNMLEVGDIKELQIDNDIKEKKLSDLMNKKKIDRDQKEEIQSLLIGYQEREKVINAAQQKFKGIYQFIKENPLKIELSKDLKKEKHHKKISRTLSLLFPIKHFKRVMMRPKHTNKELNKSNRPKGD